MIFKGLDDKKYNVFLDEYKIRWDGYSASKFQFRVKQFFRENFPEPRWQFYEEVSLVGELSQLRIDFLCRFQEDEKTKLVFIESDGKFHIEKNPHFNPTDESFIASMERDSCKYLYCQKNNIPLLRIYEDDEPLDILWFNETFDFPLGI